MAESVPSAATGAGWQIGPARLLPSRRQLWLDGQPVALGARAFDLLQALVESRERVVSKEELLARVWRGLVVEENNLQVHVSTLRKLLGSQAIATLPGQGYRFTAPVEPLADLPPDRPATAAAAPAVQPGAVGRSAVEGANAAHAASTLTSAPALRGNLPPGRTPIFGREADEQALAALLARERLVTVVGAGGIGKTTLAQVVAQGEQGVDADGTWIVELAPVVQGERVGETIASVLGLSMGKDTRPGSLAGALGCSQMLILLDNCEHLVRDVAAFADAVLRQAPGVRLLATSQEPLKVAGEQVYRLASLSVPDDPADPSAESHGALALFLARARAADAAFAPDAAGIAKAAAICRRLDGIPLAIEMAAARLPLLGLDGLHDRLDERFHVLTGGSRLALRRHQTLRAALDWSHGLLTAEEQTVFRRLGVFVGSFGLDAAQQVACDDHMDPWEVLDHLGALVDKSLVASLPGPQPRFRLLESNRAFALERLQQAGETGRVLAAHATALLDTFECSRDHELEGRLGQRLADYLPDVDNLCAALDWAAGPDGSAHFQVALAGASAWIWPDAGLRPYGMRCCREAIARIDDGTPLPYAARLLGSWSVLSHPQSGEFELDVDRRACAAYAALGDRRGLFAAQCELARTLTKNRRPAEAQVLLEQTQTMWDPAWPATLRARWLIASSWTLKQTDRVADALALDEETRAIGQASGDQRLEALAMIHLEQGAAALGRWQESLARSRELDRHLRMHPALRDGLENLVLINLGTALMQNGHLDEACAALRAALPAEERAGRSHEMFDALAMLAFRRGLPRVAARLHGRSEQLAAQQTLQRQLVERGLRDRLLAELERHLPVAELEQLANDGAGLTVHAALELATGPRDY